MHILNFRIITIAALVYLIATATVAAAPYQYHGTICVNANEAQSQLFSRSKDGITNNFIAPLFILCPLTYDQADVNQFESPEGIVRVSVYYDASVPIGTRANCLVRVSNSEEPYQPTPFSLDLGGPEPTVNLNIVQNIAFVIDGQDYPGVGDRDNRQSQRFSMANSISTAIDYQEHNVHLLCLLPQKSTLSFIKFNIVE